MKGSSVQVEKGKGRAKGLKGLHYSRTKCGIALFILFLAGAFAFLIGSWIFLLGSSETNLGVKGLITGFSSSHVYPYTCEVSTAISTAECSEEKYEREVKTYQSIHMQETCPAM